MDRLKCVDIKWQNGYNLNVITFSRWHHVNTQYGDEGEKCQKPLRFAHLHQMGVKRKNHSWEAGGCRFVDKRS